MRLPLAYAGVFRELGRVDLVLPPLGRGNASRLRPGEVARSEGIR